MGGGSFKWVIAFLCQNGECLRMEEAVIELNVAETGAMTPEDELKQRYFYSSVRETIV